MSDKKARHARHHQRVVAQNSNGPQTAAASATQLKPSDRTPVKASQAATAGGGAAQINMVRAFVSKANPSQKVSVAPSGLNLTPEAKQPTPLTAARKELFMHLTQSKKVARASSGAKKRGAMTLKKRAGPAGGPSGLVRAKKQMDLSAMSYQAQESQSVQKQYFSEKKADKRPWQNRSLDDGSTQQEDSASVLRYTENVELEESGLDDQQQHLESANIQTPSSNSRFLKPVDTSKLKMFSHAPMQRATNLQEMHQKSFDQESSRLPLPSAELTRDDLQVVQQVSMARRDEKQGLTETLMTQIGIEETAIKTIGVSGSKPKGTSGSLTERQSHLLLLSQGSFQPLETSVQASGPSLTRRQGANVGGRGGTVDVIRNQVGLRLQGMDDGRPRHNLNKVSSFERSNSLSILSATQVSPFQQQALLLIDQQLSNADFSAKLAKKKNLDKIDATQNQLTNVPYPDLLNHGQTLLQLCLNHNKIGDISEDAMRQIPQLTCLKLKANKLRKLPDSLFSLAKLRVLDVSNNLITTLSAKVSLLRQLRWLSVAENRLEGLPNSIGYLSTLDSISSEYFVYLPDQNVRANLQVSSAIAGTGDPDLDWITQHHQRQCMARNGADGRFEKMMTFMRDEVALQSTLLDLIHAFQGPSEQPTQGNPQAVFQMLDSEPMMLTEDSEAAILALQSLPSQLELQSASQPVLAEPPLTSRSLPQYSRYLPKELYNELMTVLRTLQPDRSNLSHTLIHSLIQNNHAHLLKQYATGLQKTTENCLQHLQSREAQDLFRSRVHQANIGQNLSAYIADQVKQAVSQMNDRGLDCLELALQVMQNEIADVFIDKFGKYLTLDCNTSQQAQTPVNEIKATIPSNQQNNEPFNGGSVFTARGALPDPDKAKPHPIVTTLTSGRFHIASKLIDCAMDCHFRQRAEERLRAQQESLQRQPSTSNKSLSLSSVVKNHAVFQMGGSRSIKIELNAPFSLNKGDQDSGLTYLHHLFSNFDSNPDRAANLFRKMNSLHMRLRGSSSTLHEVHLAQQRGQLQAPGEKTLFSKATRSGGHLSTVKDSKQQLHKASVSMAHLDLPTIADSITLVQRITSPQNLALSNQLQPDKPSLPDVDPLDLNPGTHYCETPLEIAVEYFQNSAVSFALTWNFNQVQTLKFAKIQRKRRSLDLPQAGNFFNLMASRNPRKYTPLHRAVICGNYNALKLLLDSPLFHQAHRFGTELSQEVQKVTFLDINAQDKLGRTARDYSHKIVFMSKLLQQATVKQVWLKAGLHEVREALFNSTIKPQVATLASGTSRDKAAVLATYDKLISHRSKKGHVKQGQNGLIGSQGGIQIRHTFFNLQAVRRDSKYSTKLAGSSLIQKRHHSIAKSRDATGNISTLASFVLRQSKRGGDDQGISTTRSENQNNARRMVKSFHAATSTGETYPVGALPPQGTATPTQKMTPLALSSVKKATPLISKSLTSQKIKEIHLQVDLQRSDKEPKPKMIKEVPQTRALHGSGIQRHSVPSSAAGIKKTSSLAFSSLSTRLDKDSQAKLFAKSNLQARHKQQETNKLVMNKPPKFRETSNQSEVIKQVSAISRLHPSEKLLNKSVSHSSVIAPPTAEVTKRNSANTSIDSITLVEGEPQRLMVREGTTSPKMEQGLLISNLLLSPSSTARMGNGLMGHSKKLNEASHVVNEYGPSGNVKQGGSTRLSLADLDSRTHPHTSKETLPKMKQVETSVELTHDFDDSGSAGSFTPLPSIQNDYALQIKSFNNNQQAKKPYSQQLSTNAFKPLFDLIMDNQCDFGAPALDEEDLALDNYLSTQREAREADRQSRPQPLKPFQKMRILFDIVNQAKQGSSKLLQDAKDVFDFIQYEIGTSQMQLVATKEKKVESKEEGDGEESKDPSTKPIAKNSLRASLSRNELISIPEKPKIDTKPNLRAPSIRQNEDILFLRHDVSYLRCQLDLIVIVPPRIETGIPTPSESEFMEIGGDVPRARLPQKPSFMGRRRQSGNDIDVDERISSSHVETTTYQAVQETHEQYTEMSASGTITDRRNKAIFSHRNPSVLLESSGGGTGVLNTATEALNVTQLTEADQELSQDFDENINTIRQETQSRRTDNQVQPSELLLGAKSIKSATVNSQKTSKSAVPTLLAGTTSFTQSRLGTLLAPRSKDKPQPLKLSHKRKSLQNLHNNSVSSSHRAGVQQSHNVSKENIETEEGHTMINQPLISAELQSFSDRLSHHRDSQNITMQSQRSQQPLLSSTGTVGIAGVHKSIHIKPKKVLTKKMSHFVGGAPSSRAPVPREILSKSRTGAQISLRSGVAQKKQTAETASQQQVLNNSATSSQQFQQPKLKYAAFAHIDLSSFDFKQKSTGGNARRNSQLQISQQLSQKSREPLQEKSRSVIAIPKSSALSGSGLPRDQAILRSQTSIVVGNNETQSVQLTSQSIKGPCLSPQDGDRASRKISGQVSQTEEASLSSHRNVTDRSYFNSSRHHHYDSQSSTIVQAAKQRQTKLLARSDSFKQITATGKTPTATQQKPSLGVSKQGSKVSRKVMPPSSSKRPLTNLGTLTSQKTSLRVLQENQKAAAQRQARSSQISAASSSVSGASKVVLGTAPAASRPQTKITHLSQLTAQSISISSPQTTKHSLFQPALSANTSAIKVTKESRQSNPLAKSTYIQPKVARTTEKPNYQIVPQTQSRQKALKSLHQSRNAGLPQTGQSASTVAMAPTKTMDGQSSQLKIRPHHRLLKDLIDSSASIKSNNYSSSAKNNAGAGAASAGQQRFFK